MDAFVIWQAKNNLQEALPEPSREAATIPLMRSAGPRELPEGFSRSGNDNSYRLVQFGTMPH